MRCVTCSGRGGPRDQRPGDKVRRLFDDGVMTPAAAQLAAAVYGFGGAPLLDRQLDLLLQGRHLLWTGMGRVAELMVGRKAPYRNENRFGGPDRLPGAQLCGHARRPAVGPSGRDAGFRPRDTAFEAEPFDLVAEMPKFSWPTVVISGGRDLTTPPEVADRVAELIPRSVLVRLETTGHSVLDSKERAALRIMSTVAAGRAVTLPAQAAALDAMPAPPALRLMVGAIGTAARVEAALPEVVPKLVAGWPARRLLREADGAVVQVAEAGRPEVGQSAAHRDVAGAWNSGRLNTSPKISLSASLASAGLVLIEFVQRLFDLRIDLRVGDLAEVALGPVV